MSTIQLSRGTFSKKFLTALAVAFLFSAVGSTKAIAGVWAVNVTHDVSESQQQTIILKGTVTDPNGEPVIGASITEKGSPKNGTVTDIDGHFSLKLKPNATLIVSYIGFQKQEVAVNGKTSITVVLKENAELLEEVVVVGYGTQKKENLTGASLCRCRQSFKKSPYCRCGTRTPRNNTRSFSYCRKWRSWF